MKKRKIILLLCVVALRVVCLFLNSIVGVPKGLRDTLVEYLEQYNVEYDMMTYSAEETIDFIRNGAQPLHVAFDPSDYYFVCGYYNDPEGEEIGWEGEVVSLRDAVQRKQRRQDIFSKERPGMKFKFSLQKGDIVKFTKDGVEQLCVIRGISLPQFHCCKISDARMKKEIQAAHCWFTPTVSAAYNWQMQKYNMNVLGELQNAND